MNLPLIIPDLPGLEINHIENTTDQVTIYASTITVSAVCPLCGTVSQRVHSSYCRHPSDLPCIGKQLRFVLTVRRFFCLNRTCKRRTFAERLGPFLAVHAQRTERLNKALGVLGLATSAEAGSRIVAKLGMPASGDTLLRIVRRLPLAERTAPRVVGIDDWAYRKGHNYGIIICDLEHAEVIDLLPDREKLTVVNWLKRYPGIEIVSRDRGTGYREAVESGAPQAIQVADRWHLLRNLFDCTKEVLESHRSLLKDISNEPKLKEIWAKLQDTTVEPVQTITVENSDPSLEDELLTLNPKLKDLPPAMRHRLHHRLIHRLRAQGVPIKAISQQTGLSRATIYRYLKVESLPFVQMLPLPANPKVQRQPREFRRQQVIQLRMAGVTIPEIVHRVGYSRASVYRILKRAGKSNLTEREHIPPRKLRRWVGRFSELWNAGNHDLQSLWETLRAEGYQMTFASVRRTVDLHYRHVPMSALSAEPQNRIGPRWAAWLFVSDPSKLEPRQYWFLLFAIKTSPVLLQVYALAQAFQRLITQTRSLALFEHWLKRASSSPFPEFQRFANGLTEDQAAVQAALRYNWSSGQVEGQVNRLKLIKREMYGRASFDLLRQRVLQPI